MKLSIEDYNKVVQYIRRYGRQLDIDLFDYHFHRQSSSNSLMSLGKYQNLDGGFGHGLEPDFTTTQSSSIATTLAIQYLEKVDVESSNNQLTRALQYLTTTFSSDLDKWRPVPVGVNDTPHAPWWHIDPTTNMCAIDASWANPTVEVLGYLHKYPSTFASSELSRLTQKAVNYFNQTSDVDISEHSLYCYIAMYSHVDQDIQQQIKPRLAELILKSINTNIHDWQNKYVPKPLQFVDSPDSDFYPLIQSLIKQNLDFLVVSIKHNDAWYPNWSWGDDSSAWQRARQEWSGKISVDNLIILDRFGMIDRY